MALEGNDCFVKQELEVVIQRVKTIQALQDLGDAMEMLARTMRDYGEISRRIMERIDFINASMRKIKDRSRWHAKGPMRIRSMERALVTSQRWRIHE